MLDNATKKATSSICSSAMHLHKEELSLPARGKLIDLKGDRLDYFKNECKNLMLVAVDKFAMISQKMLFYTDKRLRQITIVNKPFGGVVMVLIRDLGQLPPLGSNNL